MDLLKKIEYYFRPNSNKQEQALLMVLFITLFLSLYLLYINIQRDIGELIYLKSIYIFFDIFCIFAVMYKSLLASKVSNFLIFFLFIIISTEILYTPSKIEVLLLLMFFPIATLMLLHKNRAAKVVLLFIFMNIFFYSFLMTEVRFDFHDSITVILGIVVFAAFISFYINSIEQHQNILKEKNSQIKQQHGVLSNIFNKAPIIFSSFDEFGHLTFVSDYELILMNKSREETIGRHFSELYINDPELIEKFKSLYQLQEREFTYSIYRHHFDFRLSRQENDQGNFSGYSMIAMDITEQIRFKDELKKSEDRLEIVTSTAFEAIIISHEDKIIKANQKALEMFGYQNMEDVIDKNVRQFIALDSMYSVYKHALKNDEDPHLIRGLREDGSSFPMELKGKTINYFDQTFRVSAIQSLDTLSKAKDEIAKLAQVVEQNSSIIMITNAQGYLEYVNQAFVDKMGYSREEVINRKPNVISSGHHKVNFYEELWSTISKGDVWSKEMTNRTKSGEVITVKNNISSITNDHGEITHYIAMQEDITHLKEQERMLFAQTKQAQMGEMLSMIAHQWRQPLSAISVIGAKLRFALELKTLNDKMIKENLSMIDMQIQFLSDTIDDFRNFFKPNKKLVVINAQTLIKKATNIISKQIELQNVTLTIDKSVDIKIKTYSHEVVQVLLSLIQNSLDQMQSKLLVTKEITLSVSQDNEFCVIMVKDTAGGIPHEIIDDIFLPYFSTKNEKQGTGLGLHMCKTIVEEHCHGSIKAENWEEGVCFFISLPL